MCQYSLEGYKTREAKEGETVYAVANSHGAFSSEPGRHSAHIKMGQSEAVCVLYGQKVTIENLQVENGSRFQWTGKRHVAKLVRLIEENGKYGDHLVLVGGPTIPIWMISPNCPIYVGVKSSTQKGMDKIAEALTEVKKTTPTGIVTAVKRAISRRRKADVNA